MAVDLPVLVCSTFDLMHAGHMLMLKEAKNIGNRVIVGLQVDASTTDVSYRGKWKDSPIMSLHERKIMLEGCKYVDDIFIYTDEEDLFSNIKQLPQHIRLLGSDWKYKKATGQDFADEVIYHDRGKHDYSTTNLKKKIVQAYEKNN